MNATCINRKSDISAKRIVVNVESNRAIDSDPTLSFIHHSGSPFTGPRILAIDVRRSSTASASVGMKSTTIVRGTSPAGTSNGSNGEKSGRADGASRAYIAAEMMYAPAMGAAAVPLRIFSPFLRPVEAVSDEVLKDCRIELVVNAVAIAFSGDEIRLAENIEVSRDSRARGRKPLRDFTRRERAFVKHLNDLSPCWIGQRFEHYI